MTDHPEPPTQDSVPSAAVAFGPRPVPSVGVWVGPHDEPARYERLDHVGGGAEGAIHRARFVGRGGPPLPVAIKQYRPPPGAPADWPHDGTWHQIRDQAWLLAGLARDDHLVRVREVFLGAVSAFGIDRDPAGAGKSFDTPFVVMEWIDGTAPDALLRRGGVDLDTRLRWVEDLAAAVDVLHSLSRTRDAPLVHADIKPANCLVTPDRGLVLVDTGAVQRSDGSGDHRGLRSPPYAAPEVLAGPGRRRDAATDLYSLGAVAFFFLTGQAPPGADRPAYLAEARAALSSCTALPPARRRPVTDHVAALLDPEPGRRPSGGAAHWARELRRLAAPDAGRSRGRPVALALSGVAAVAVLVGTSALLGGRSPDAVVPPPSTSAATPSPAPLPPGTLDWASLPAETPATASLYEQDFATPSPDWVAEEIPPYTTAYAGGGFELRMTERGVFVPVPAPPARSVSDEVVSATATIMSGQGAWGVWCRGVDEVGSSRYEFLISHAGAVQIIGADGEGTGWVYLRGVDLTAPVTLSARCADVGTAPVVLTLGVNGRTALTYRPRTILGPGHAGIEGMTFSDVAGPTVTARFRSFAVARPG